MDQIMKFECAPLLRIPKHLEIYFLLTQQYTQHLLQFQACHYDSLKLSHQVSKVVIRETPSVRFYLVEELSSKKKALSNLKMLCDGKLYIRELRGHDHAEIPIHGKLLATSNEFIRFTDGGINRRIMYYENKVVFVSPDAPPLAGQCHGSPLLTPITISPSCLAKGRCNR
jgi:hypothetical protein